MIPEAQQSAWIALAAQRNVVAADLQKRELALQALLLNQPKEKLSEQLKLYRLEHTALVEARRKFTSIIDEKIVQKLMEFEKRTDPKTYDVYLQAVKDELQYRTDEDKKLSDQRTLATETANFKIHFQNQFNTIATNFRVKCNDIIMQAYASCLDAKTPADQIHVAISAATAAITDLKNDAPEKFVRIHLKDAEAKEIFLSLNQPDFAAIRKEYIDSLPDRFEMYANDLANAEQAVELLKQEAQAINQQLLQETKSENAANDLLEHAAAYIIPVDGHKSVVEVSEIKIIDDDPAWCLKIMTAFITNFNSCFTKIRVKKYSELKVSQMAAALDAADLKVKDVEYIITKK